MKGQGQNNFQRNCFLNPFTQLPSVKKDSKNVAARKCFGPSYSSLALALQLFASSTNYTLIGEFSIVYIILATILGHSSVQKNTLVIYIGLANAIFISQLHCSKSNNFEDPLIMTHSTSMQCTVHFFSTLVEMNKRLVTYGQFGILYDFIIPPI